jgi:hypothetical protein
LRVIIVVSPHYFFNPIGTIESIDTNNTYYLKTIREKYMKKALFSLGLLILSSSLTFADNWANWRGPNMDGSSTTAKPPVEWDTAKNVLWKVSIDGSSSATPIVWENKVYVVTAIETDKKKEGAEQPAEQPQEGGRRRGGGQGPTNYYQFKVMCYDLNTGDEIWSDISTEIVPHEGHHQTNTFASGSPTTDGKNLYVTFGSAGIFVMTWMATKSGIKI